MESKLCKKCEEWFSGNSALRVPSDHCHHDEVHIPSREEFKKMFVNPLLSVKDEVSGDAPDAITKLKARVKELETAIGLHRINAKEKHGFYRFDPDDDFYDYSHENELYWFDEQLYAVLEKK